MEQRQINVTAQAIAELRALLEVHRNTGAESIVKPFREFCERHGWDWFGLEPKREFNFNAIQLAAAYSHGLYSDERLQQLRERDCAFWIFHAADYCPDEHVQFDGLVLPPAHGFWNRYYPPLGWKCGCYVLGADREPQIRRLHGDPDKKLPGWWNTIDPQTELPPGVEEPWIAPQAPDLLFLLAAMVDGHSPKPNFG